MSSRKNTTNTDRTGRFDEHQFPSRIQLGERQQYAGYIQTSRTGKNFNVSVDELLGENSKLVHFAMADQVEQYVVENQITSEKLRFPLSNPQAKPS